MKKKIEDYTDEELFEMEFNEDHPLFEFCKFSELRHWLKENDGRYINELVEDAPSWCKAVLDEKIANEAKPGLHTKY